MVEESNAGFAAGIAKRSKVQKIAWALSGAPPRKRDLRLTALGGVAEGRKLRDKVTRLMSEASANPEDAMVLCVFAEPDLSFMVPEVLVLPVRSGARDIEIAMRHADKLPIGFLVFVCDASDPQRPIFGHARPLIVEDPRGLLFNEMALHSYKRQIEQRTVQKGEAAC
ncbi:MAG: hypothetical protein ABSG84_05325 [Acidobacteriaceae bacterium]|jgi:hypothetical protein